MANNYQLLNQEYKWVFVNESWHGQDTNRGSRPVCDNHKIWGNQYDSSPKMGAYLIFIAVSWEYDVYGSKSGTKKNIGMVKTKNR